MKYISYCRKSSEEDSKQIQSLDTQERILTDLANRLGLEVIDTIRESKSAKSDGNRPLFNSLLDRIIEGEAQGILVVHTDRLSRNFIEAGQIIKLIENKKLLEVRTPSNTYDSVQSLLYMGFDFVFASHYSRDLSVKVRAGNESKLLKGEYPSLAPLGYKNVPNGIILHSQKAPLITRMFELYATGEYSLKALTKIMYLEGLRTRLGNKVVKAVIYRMLTNPEYYGVIRRNGEFYRGNHAPLISKQLFENVQEVLLGRNRTKKQTHFFTYRDFLSCHVCGCKLTATIKKGRYRYYYCTNGKGKCTQHKKYLNENKVKQLLMKEFQKIKVDSELAELSLQVYLEDLKKSNHHQTDVINSLKKDIELISKKLDKLEDMLLEERISEDRYDAKRKKLKKEQIVIELDLKKLKKKTSFPTLEPLYSVKEKICNLEIMFNEGNDEVKRELLAGVLWNCTIADQKVHLTRFRKPFVWFEGVGQTGDLNIMRRWWDSNPRALSGHAFQACAINH